MGIFASFVQKSQPKDAEAQVTPSDRLVTPANVMSAARPLLAMKAAEMLLHGKRGVLPLAVVIAATDGEGNMARFIDKKWPESGLGTSVKGAELDPIADTMAFLTIAGAALKAPRVSLLAKSAVATVLGQEGVKTAWAVTSAIKYQKQTGSSLHIPVDVAGKEATVEKFAALTAAVATSETDNVMLRTGLGALAIACAVSGALRSERVREQYQQQVEEMLVISAASNAV